MTKYSIPEWFKDKVGGFFADMAFKGYAYHYDKIVENINRFQTEFEISDNGKGDPYRNAVILDDFVEYYSAMEEFNWFATHRTNTYGLTAEEFFLNGPGMECAKSINDLSKSYRIQNMCKLLGIQQSKMEIHGVFA